MERQDDLDVLERRLVEAWRHLEWTAIQRLDHRTYVLNAACHVLSLYAAWRTQFEAIHARPPHTEEVAVHRRRKDAIVRILAPHRDAPTLWSDAIAVHRVVTGEDTGTLHDCFGS